MTSTLQQEAGRKLRFCSARTMRVAQDLYEQGYITYMRTDSTTLSDQALEPPGRRPARLYGADYVPGPAPPYDKKVKNAQEAHEAIRPAGEHFRTPEQTGLRGDMRRLYELVWMRTVASQMADAVGQSVQVRLGGVSSRRARTPSSPPAAGSSPSPASCGPTWRAPTTPTPSSRTARSACRPWPSATRSTRAGTRRRGPRHPAAGPLHRGVAGQGARGAGRRPPLDLRQHHRHHPGPRLRLEKGHAPWCRPGPPSPSSGCSSSTSATLVDYGFTATMEEDLDDIASGRPGVGARG